MELKPKKETNTGEWLNTYADMITLILCFFVLLYSMSTVNEEKWANLVKSLNPNLADDENMGVPSGSGTIAIGVGPYESAKNPATEDSSTPTSSATPTGTEELTEDLEIKNIYDKIVGYAEENGMSDFVDVFKADGFAFIVFRNKIFFEGDRSKLLPEGRKIMDVFNGAIREIAEEVAELRVYGHTAQASLTRPNDIRVDRTLASDRADEVSIYIEENVTNLSGKKIIAVGYGQYYPVAPNNSEANRAKNRRVEILVAKSERVNMTIKEIYDELGIEIVSE